MQARLLALLLLTSIAHSAHSAELVRMVRLKITAGDLLSGAAAVEDHRMATGVDAEYLDAVGWLARGAEMLGRPDLAREYVGELRRAIPAETTELLIPLGAAIEVEGRLIAAHRGRGAAVKFFEGELARATAPSLRSRIAKNINLLSMEGHPAPAIENLLDDARGKPVLAYFFAEWCGDCKAQAASLARIWKKYRPLGLEMVAVTRLYGDSAAEPEKVAKVWKDLYGDLEGVPLVIDTGTMIRYGASATPTFALIDRKGVVRLYTPTRMSEAEMARRIDEVLAEPSAE